MKIVADEGVDRAVVERLRSLGHAVLYIAEMTPGIPDGAVLDLANAEAALLLTSDKDFGEIVFRRRQVSSGVVLLRLAGLPSSHKADRVEEVFRRHGEKLAASFAVVSGAALRIRRAS